MTVYSYDISVDTIKPPVTSVGVLGWAKRNLFDGWFNSILTIIILALLVKTVPPLVKWALVDSHWLPSGSGCQNGQGACWSIVTANLRFIIFGFYTRFFLGFYYFFAKIILRFNTGSIYFKNFKIAIKNT